MFVLIETSSEDKDERRLQDVLIKANVCWVYSELVGRFCGQKSQKYNEHKLLVILRVKKVVVTFYE